MKKIIVSVAMIASLAVSVAQAQEWVCEFDSTKIRLIDETRREGALMILSDTRVGYGNRTIAKFSEANGTLDLQSEDHYLARVDLRFSDSGRGGEYLFGTRLNQIETIRMMVNPELQDGEGGHSATVIVHKRNGSASRTEQGEVRCITAELARQLEE